MLISRLHGHMYAIRSTKSVPGAHRIGGDSRAASQSLSTRTKFGDQQYVVSSIPAAPVKKIAVCIYSRECHQQCLYTVQYSVQYVKEQKLPCR